MTDARLPSGRARRRARGPALALALALALAATVLSRLSAARAEDDPPAAVVVGLLPSEHAEITAALVAGLETAAREAEAAGRRRFVVVVGRPAPAWGTAGSEAVRVAFDEQAVLLVTPPDRRLAHVIAQVGTKAHVPVLTTAPARGVTGAGSLWVFAVVPAEEEGRTPRADAAPPKAPAFDAESPAGAAFAHAFRARTGRAPDGWAAAGYDAGAALLAALDRAGTDREALSRALAAPDFAFPGTAGRSGFDGRGRLRARPAADDPTPAPTR